MSSDHDPLDIRNDPLNDLDLYEDFEDYNDAESFNMADFIATHRLTKDLLKASATLKRNEVRYLVDMYYNMQRQRIRAAAQIRSGTIKNDEGEVIEEPNQLISWTLQLYAKLEEDMKQALHKYAQSTIAGQWALSVMGIGPVITAGLLCHIDVTIAQTSGDVWRYAGYDPSIEWLGAERARKTVREEVGFASTINYDQLTNLCIKTARKLENWERVRIDPKTKQEKWLIDPINKTAKTSEIIAELSRRPWNAGLKRLGFLAGQSFVKSKNREGSFYGPLYDKRKLYEMEKNMKFAYKEQAERILATKNFGDDTKAKQFYMMGMLPPNHIQRRTERWTVKMFFSHVFQVMFEVEHKREMPKPWILASQPDVHTHYIAPPNWPISGYDRGFNPTY